MQQPLSLEQTAPLQAQAPSKPPTQPPNHLPLPYPRPSAACIFTWWATRRARTSATAPSTHPTGAASRCTRPTTSPCRATWASTCTVRVQGMCVKCPKASRLGGRHGRPPGASRFAGVRMGRECSLGGGRRNCGALTSGGCHAAGRARWPPARVHKLVMPACLTLKPQPGHCYYLEDGIEENNVLERNLAAHVHPIQTAGSGGGQQGTDRWQNASLFDPSDAGRQESTLCHLWARACRQHAQAGQQGAAGLRRVPSPHTQRRPYPLVCMAPGASGFYSLNAYNSWIDNAAVGGFSGFTFRELRLAARGTYVPRAAACRCRRAQRAFCGPAAPGGLPGAGGVLAR